MSCRLFLSIFFVCSFFSCSAMAEEPLSLVTVREYADFLNAVAPADYHSLYHETMSEIVRTGKAGEYQYEVREGTENLPITYVTWFDAARYCNWKEHGSPARDEMTPEVTETGSYTLNDGMTQFVMKNQGAHYVLPRKEEDEFGVPTLASNELGFYVVETISGDALDVASFLAATHSDEGEGTISTFDEVIGAITALALIGGGYAYRRAHLSSEQLQPLALGEQQQRAVDLRNAARDSSARAQEEERLPLSEKVDDVTGQATGESLFAPDQRSYSKKWADWLRDREFSESIFSTAHLIAYNDNLGDKQSHQRPDPWTRKAFLHWLTRSFYPYETLADFKQRDPAYLNWQLKQYEATIAAHELKIQEHETTIGQHERTIAGHQATIGQHEATIAVHELKIQQHEITIGQHERTIEGHQATIGQHEVTIYQHERTIAGHQATIGQHEATIAEHQVQAQILQASSGTEAENRKKRIEAYQIRKKSRVVVEDCLELVRRVEKGFFNVQQHSNDNLPEIASSLSAAAKTDFRTPIAKGKSMMSGPRSALSKAASHQEIISGDITPAESISRTVSTTPLEKAAEVTRDYLIVKILLQQMNTEHFDLPALTTLEKHLNEAWNAYIHLVGTKRALSSKKDLLERDFVILGSEQRDYCPISKLIEIEQKLPSIKTKIEGYSSALQFSRQQIDSSLLAVQKEFRDDTASIASRESISRISSTTTPDAQGKQKVKKTILSRLSKWISPSKSSSAAPQKAAQVTAGEVTQVPHETEQGMENRFSKIVIPIIRNLHALRDDSYQYLHLIETNFLKARDLIELYQADQGKLVMTTSGLMSDLTERLKDARKGVKCVEDIFSQIEGELGGEWKEEKTAMSQTTYAYQQGGWRAIDSFEIFNQALQKFSGYQKQIDVVDANALNRGVTEAQAIASLLRDAEEKSKSLLPQIAGGDLRSIDNARVLFLEAMEPLLHFSGVTISLSAR